MTDNHTELCEKLRQASIQCSDCGMYETSSDFDLAVSMIESQAARIQQQAERIAELEKERDALIHDNAQLLKAASAEATFASEALAERDALKADAERYRWAIASDENATALYVAVFSCGPNAKNSIDAEMDAAIQAEKETR